MTSSTGDSGAAADDRRRRLALAATAIVVSIWGLQFVMIRLAVTTSLTATDVTLLRYIFALPVMIPILWRYGWRNGAGLGWRKAIILTLCGGAPMLMLSNIGLQFAPASHAACLQPGTVAVLSTLFLMMTSATRGTWLIPAGLAISVLGLAIVTLGGANAGAAASLTPLGDALFMASGLLWTIYTVLLVRWKASPLVMTAVSAVASIPLMPLFGLFLPMNILSAPVADLLLHGLFQGVVNYAIAFLLWAYAARVLGAVQMGYVAPLIPVFGVLFAIPILGEWPAHIQWLGIAAAVCGLGLIALAQKTPAHSVG
ncbi:MAG: hypothetical protein BGP06_05910 [Rhizobiales bacterium 65-9]|nr:DMT family transporter [Hyphomicrobiales bacterium]OJY35399.1 MAG: hypothetical protein BGP06_05910 [Rhizobiales bacterium 65-9]